MEKTNLKDRNGKELFKDDIIIHEGIKYQIYKSEQNGKPVFLCSAGMYHYRDFFPLEEIANECEKLYNQPKND